MILDKGTSFASLFFLDRASFAFFTPKGAAATGTFSFLGPLGSVENRKRLNYREVNFLSIVYYIMELGIK